MESSVTKLTQQYLSTKHSALQKAVSDLSNKIKSLQTQKSKLSEQIKSTSTSDALGKHPTSSAQLVSNYKSNVVVYGVEKNPPKMPRNVWLQKDMETISQILKTINVRIDPTHILDCFRLGRFKLQQTRSRPILVKLQHSIDANAILANKSTLSSPLSIKPDMTDSEHAIESALLKRHWQLIRAGHDRRQIKFSGNRMYINGKVFR